jgi:hypothetical protein
MTGRVGAGVRHHSDLLQPGLPVELGEPAADEQIGAGPAEAGAEDLAEPVPGGQRRIAQFDALEDIANHRWGQGATIEWYLPSRADSAHARELFARFERIAVSPSAFLRMLRMIREIDVRAVLPAIRVPTLVVQRRGDRITPPCHGRYLASHITGARYFEQPGDHSLRFAGSGDSDALCNEIEDFITDVPQAHDPGRLLATILLTTVADGPATASGAGRCGPGGTLDAHSAAALGTAIRAGIHTGEVGLAGDDITGTSVLIADRVAALAQPAEILVSRTVKDLLAGSGIAFTSRGSHKLAGIGEQWPLFAVTRL